MSAPKDGKSEKKMDGKSDKKVDDKKVDDKKVDDKKVDDKKVDNKKVDDGKSDKKGSDSKSSSSPTGNAKGSTQNTLEETIKKKEFKNQFKKWGHHRHLPHWAEDQLVKRVEHEINRRKEMDKSPTGKVHEGDISFPVHAPKKKDAPSSPKKTKAAEKPESAEVEDDTEYEDEEALMTDDLVNEIMDDQEDDTPTLIIENAGVEGVDPWALTVKEMIARNNLFTKACVHENTLRSIALVNPKPGDPYPGETKLTSTKNIAYAELMFLLDFDEDKLDKDNGITATSHIPLGDYLMTN